MNQWPEISRPRGCSVEIVLQGELDIASIDDVIASFSDALPAAHSQIRLDLAEVESIDCAGLSAVLATQTAAGRSG